MATTEAQYMEARRRSGLSPAKPGRIGYREWAIRLGRMAGDYIHSLDDKYDHDVDVALSR
jgi:hypothetical protein